MNSNQYPFSSSYNIDFDQYPDNSIKRIDKGLVFKLSIDDLGSIANIPYLNGIGLKYYSFSEFDPETGFDQTKELFIRCHYKNEVEAFDNYSKTKYGPEALIKPESNSTVISFDIKDFVDVAREDYYELLMLSKVFRVNVGLGCISVEDPLKTAYACCLGLNMDLIHEKMVWKDNYYMVDDSVVLDHQVKLSVSASAGYPGDCLSKIKGGYAFFACKMIEVEPKPKAGSCYHFLDNDFYFQIGGHDQSLRRNGWDGYLSHHGVSAERLEDLPKQAHEIYPKSWLS